MTDVALSNLTACQAATEIARGAISAQDYTRACLARIEEVESEIQAFAHFDPAHAIAQARELDAHKARGGTLGPLHGIPVAIKDIIDTSDYPTEFGSPLFKDRRPFDDATIVAKLRSAGAVILGKTVTTEFAYFHPGKTRNPHDTARTPGGSSSGSAAAVASGMVPLAIGSQTNGSIIRPASFCGVFAIKPSHGLVSRHGVLTLSRALDHVGPFARTLEDLGLILETLAGFDPEDPDTRPIAVPPFRKAVTEKFPLEPRIAFVRTPIWDKADIATRTAFEGLAEALGPACYPVELPERYAEAWEAHRVVMASDMAHRFGALVDQRGDGVSSVLHDLVAEGRKVTATQYLAARDLAQSLAKGLNEIFEECNAIITPAAPGVAPIGHNSTGNPAFCSLWTLVGLPSISLPLLEGEGGMPLGVQLIGARNDDVRLFRTAKWLAEKITPKGKKRAKKS
ncbi:amidase [Pseudorhodoplanes sinuspersici]|uniref:Amidase n=1 Tax=Pseudorhodoplanes sinuspersici TaxID=1235591 RepID=A0A1W6ZR92_9HYPH|nr:amidase [Pseudorhodoplanes sinuspersici]ARP99913.1 amidase [Pseudorhodoplanes sinuspersici]RKE70933.1 Asp-tRNA(Asn)/Glu-tRNA(Gln) amidotransferase A subunit family amidase [Pseudorhodoplanes sinuspersici]